MRRRPDNSIHPSTKPDEVITKIEQSCIPKKLYHFTNAKGSSNVNWEEEADVESIIKGRKTFVESVRCRGESTEKKQSFILLGSDNTTEFYLTKGTGVNVDVTYRSAPQG